MSSAPARDVAVIDPGPDDADAHRRADGRDRRCEGRGDLLHAHPPRSFARRRAAGALTGARSSAARRSALVPTMARAPMPASIRPMRPTASERRRRCSAGDGWTLTAVATPGHTSNHLCFALEESGALFTGDHVMGWSTSVVSPPDGDMTAYMASLQKLYEREDRVYYPAHGPQVDKTRQLVRGMIGHRRQRENQILKLLARANVRTRIPLHGAAHVQGRRRQGCGPPAGRSVLAAPDRP
jgi:glyoxylase-like metal-dependent hydrolase (beta-lactamase superfamily II)